MAVQTWTVPSHSLDSGLVRFSCPWPSSPCWLGRVLLGAGGQACVGAHLPGPTGLLSQEGGPARLQNSQAPGKAVPRGRSRPQKEARGRSWGGAALPNDRTWGGQQPPREVKAVPGVGEGAAQAKTGRSTPSERRCGQLLFLSAVSSLSFALLAGVNMDTTGELLAEGRSGSNGVCDEGGLCGSLLSGNSSSPPQA